MATGLFIGFFLGALCGFAIGTHDADKMYAYERDQHWHWFDKYIAAATKPSAAGKEKGV